MKKLTTLSKRSKIKLISSGILLSQWFPTELSNRWSLPLIVQNVLRIVFVLAGVIAVVYLVWGGYQYITSGGGEGAENGKKTIVNAVIGLIIIIAAFAIVNFVWSWLTGTQLLNATNNMRL